MGKNCSSVQEKLLQFEAAGQDVAKILRSLEQFIQTVEGQKNFRQLIAFLTSLFNDPTRNSIANNFVISFYCRCLQILYQIAFFYKF